MSSPPLSEPNLLGDLPADLRDAFAPYQARLLAEGVMRLTGLGVLLFPSFLVLDALIYPSRLLGFALIRGAVTLALGLLYLLGRRLGPAGVERHHRAFMAAFILIGTLGLDAIIALAGGLDTPYYAGMNLLLLAIAGALPQQVYTMAAIQLGIVVQLNLLRLLSPAPIDLDALLNANFFLVSTLVIGLIFDASAYRLRVGEFLARLRVEAARKRSDELLLNILPEEVAEELKRAGRVQARHIESCTILFTDFVGFTHMSARVGATGLVHSLDLAFRQFDEIITRHGLEKLKTIGDSYMCAGGVLDRSPGHLARCLLAGMEMIEVLEHGHLRAPDGGRWRMRLGVHTGPVVAGVIGDKKFAYDLWGDTVNTASRMESTGQPSSINMASDVYAQVAQLFEGEDRGFISVRGKGPVAMTRVLRLRPAFSADPDGRRPNAAFFAAAQLSAAPAPVPPAAPAGPFADDPLAALTMLLPEDRALMQAFADRVPVPAGGVLIEEGQDLSVLFLVSRGLLGVNLRRDGIDVQVATLGPGEVVGELSFVSLEPASATVRALEDGEVLRFDLHRLQRSNAELAGLSGRLFHSFALILAQRVRASSARLFHRRAQRRRGALLLTAPSAALDPADAAAIEALRATLDALAQQPSAAAVDTLWDQLQPLLAAGPVGQVALREALPLLLRSELLAACAHDGLSAILAPFAAQQLPSADPLGQAIDQRLQQSPLAAVLRLSLETAAADLDEALDQGALRLCILGPGAGLERYRSAPDRPLPPGAHLTLGEPDLDALVAVARRAAARGEPCTFLHTSARGPRGSATPLRLAPQDIILVPRLLAPLPDDAMFELFEQLHAGLAPGGRCVLTALLLPPADRALFALLRDLPLPAWQPGALAALAARSALAPHFRPLPAPDGLERVALRRA